MKLDDERRDKYTSSDGAFCPVCGSDAIKEDKNEISAGLQFCTDCSSEWKEVYEITWISIEYIAPERECAQCGEPIFKEEWDLRHEERHSREAYPAVLVSNYHDRCCPKCKQ